VRGLVEDVVELFGGRAQLANLRITCRVAPDVPSNVLLDGPRVQQTLANLVSNAVKFSDHGEVAVEAVRLTAKAEHVRLRFSVSDTGIGIPEQERARLFCAFSQLGVPPARRGGGTGLGLFICKQLVENMGGSIGMESNAGEGSRFWFELSARVLSEAVVANEPAPPGGPSAPIPGEPMSMSPRTRPRLLIAEDDPLNRGVLVELLDRAGYDADVVEDGLAAVQAAAAGSYPLLLLDCRMPKLDGYETARRIRRREGPLRRSVIVAVTADGSPAQRAKALAAGMDCSLTKPIDVAVLNEVLQRWCPAAVGELTLAAPLQRTAVGAASPTRGGSAATRLFLEHAPAQLARMSRAVAEEQQGELADAAHRLKGSCFAIGAERLAQLCAELEVSPHGASATLAHEYTLFETEHRRAQPHDRERQLLDGRS
jgi:CheY-like chemotaxis protein